jgi:GrpB-like predicted nucleotidyltransferase (UPF0157 family)
MLELDEPIEIVDARAEWAALYDAEAAALWVALRGVAVGVEHIGSTAVAGLAGKPIVDIQVGVVGPPELRLVERALVRLGYEGLGEAGVPGRLYFRKRGGTEAALGYNAHVVMFGGGHWVGNLAIRDYLRAHPGECAAYAMHKRNAVAGGAATLLAYSQRKAEFVGELERRARAWVAR